MRTIKSNGTLGNASGRFAVARCTAVIVLVSTLMCTLTTTAAWAQSTAEPATPATHGAGVGLFLKHGFVARVEPGVRTWVQVLGVAGFLLVPCVVCGWCIKRYRLPLTPAELGRTRWICIGACLACYQLTWGSALAHSQCSPFDVCIYPSSTNEEGRSRFEVE